MRNLSIVPLCPIDDLGFSDPYRAIYEIRLLQCSGQITEELVEKIARMHNCCVEWSDGDEV